MNWTELKLKLKAGYANAEHTYVANSWVLHAVDMC